MSDVGFSEESGPFGDVVVEEGGVVCFVEEVVNYHDWAVLRVLLCHIRLRREVPRGTLRLGSEDDLYLLLASC